MDENQARLQQETLEDLEERLSTLNGRMEKDLNGTNNWQSTPEEYSTNVRVVETIHSGRDGDFLKESI